MSVRFLLFVSVGFSRIWTRLNRNSDTLPEQFTDVEFRRMTRNFSEADGALNMEIMTSNKGSCQEDIPA